MIGKSIQSLKLGYLPMKQEFLEDLNSDSLSTGIYPLNDKTQNSPLADLYGAYLFHMQLNSMVRQQILFQDYNAGCIWYRMYVTNKWLGWRKLISENGGSVA